jgi:nitrogen fixation NifU-like protein
MGILLKNGRILDPASGKDGVYDLLVENDVIVDVKFNTFGCGSAIATSSMATEMIKGKTIQEALELSNRAVVEALDGLPPQKIHCSVLAEEAVKAAVRDYYERNGIEYYVVMQVVFIYMGCKHNLKSVCK